MINVSTIKISKKKTNLLQIPRLEETIQINILMTKRRFETIVLLGCITLGFGICYAYYDISHYVDKLNDEGKLLYDPLLKFWLEFVLTSIMCQLLVGFTIDLISLKSSLVFSIIICILGMIFNLLCLSLKSNHGLLLGMIFSEIGYTCFYMCSIYIIFDSSYSLKSRFNNAGLFLTFSVYLPTFLSKLQVMFNDEHVINSLLINGIGILLSLIGFICIYISYNKMERERQKSIIYQQFVMYQGVGITLKTITKYYKNRHIIFLLVIQFIFCLISSRSNPGVLVDVLQEEKSDKYLEYFLKISNMASIILIGIPILYFINSRNYIIESSMKTSKILLVTSFVVISTDCIFICFASYIPYNLTYVIFFISSIYQGSIHLFSVIAFNQVMSCFQDDRCSIKSTGFALITLFQDSASIIFNNNFKPLTIFIIQLISLVLSIIYSHFYLKNKSFKKLESFINKQLHKENNIYSIQLYQQQQQNIFQQQQQNQYQSL